jgi:putative transposase
LEGGIFTPIIGVPFASPNAPLGLSKLSVWWLGLGIEIEPIKPTPT